MAKNRRFTRVGRLVGAFAVVGALVAGPMAGGASASTLGSFAGQGSGFALRVVVDFSGLPQAAKDAIQTLYAPVAQASGGKLPAKFPFVIDQRFIETLSDMGKTMSATSVLGRGLISDVAGAVTKTDFNQSATATKAGESSNVTTAEKSLPDASLPVVKATVGKLTAAVTAAPRVSSNGTLASVQTSLKTLLDAGILPDAVKTALQQVTTQVNGVIDTVNNTSGTLGGVLDTVGNTLASTPANSTLGGVLGQAGLGSAIGDPTQMVSQLQSLVQIPHVNDLLGGVGASVNGLVNTAVAQKTSVAAADATSKIASIDLLGLLHVGVIDLASHSEAAGTPGSAKNTSRCTIAAVNLGTGAGVSLDGKSLLINGVAIPVPTADISAVKNAVSQVLNVAGMSVGLCDAANKSAAADGKSASQTVSALRIQFAPTLTSALPQSVTDTLGIVPGTPLVKIIIDPSVETQVSATQAAAVSPALPHTGAAPLATVVTGMIVAGGALILRRRLAA